MRELIKSRNKHGTHTVHFYQPTERDTKNYENALLANVVGDPFAHVFAMLYNIIKVVKKIYNQNCYSIRRITTSVNAGNELCAGDLSF